MISLQEYFFENLSKRQQLIDYLSSKNDDDDDVNKLYNVLKKYEFKDKISKWLEDKMSNDNVTKHKDDLKSAIYGLCDELHCWVEIHNLADAQQKNKNKSFFNINFENSFNINNIYEHYKNKKFNIPIDFWKKLINKGASNKPVIGPGEFLLRIISKNPGNEKLGDVVLNNVGVEVKYLFNCEAKIGNDSVGNTESIYNFLNDIITTYKLDVNKIDMKTISMNPRKSPFKENSEKIIKLLNEISSQNEQNKISIVDLKESLINNLKNSKSFSIDDNDNTIIEETIKRLIGLKNENNVNISNFVKIFTILFIYLYCKEENAKYLCIIDRECNFKFININKDIFNNIYNDAYFPFYLIRCDNKSKLINISYDSNHKNKK